MTFLEKLQNLPLKTRKAIVWSVALVLAAGLLIFWSKSAQKRFENFNGQGFWPDNDFPKIEFPKIEGPTGELKDQIQELEGLIKDAQEEEEKNATATQ